MSILAPSERLIEITGRWGQTTVVYDPTRVLAPDFMSFGAGRYVADEIRLSGSVLDIGTGCGIFLTSLLMHVDNPHWLELTALDIDRVALEYARRNVEEACRRRDAEPACHYVESNWIDLLIEQRRKYNYIYFNPGFLPEGEAVRGEAALAPMGALYGEMHGYHQVFPYVERIAEPNALFFVRTPNDLDRQRRVLELLYDDQPNVGKVVGYEQRYATTDLNILNLGRGLIVTLNPRPQG